jgi:diguanylate cyclase (GGDEF)-like protein
MHRVILIGKGLSAFSDGLSLKGYRTSGFDSFEKALPEIANASAILIETGINPSLKPKEIFSASRGIPKVFVSLDEGRKERASLLREPLTYLAVKPSPAALAALLRRAASEKALFEENCLLREQNSALEKGLGFFDDLSRAMTTADQSGVLSLLVKKIKEMTGAETCTIYSLDEETGDIVKERTEGGMRSAKEGLATKPSESLLGWVAREGKPILVKNAYKDAKFYQKLDREIRHRTRSVICVPIKSRNRTLGLLELINRADGEEFTQRDFANILRFIDHVAIVIERATLYEKMQELVITDDLTKLFNTRYMSRTIETEVLRSNRYKTSVSLIFMDIDYFKSVNDSHGHLVGSKVLVEMGQLLLKHLRDVDIVARYGGDEFVIILPHTHPQRAVKIAERIRQTVEQNVFLRKEGFNLKLTASFGVASYPESAKSKEDLIRLADEAMYKVKHRTRNGVYAIIDNGAV